MFLDTFIGEKSLEWLNEHDNTGAPWHLTVSFAGPHNPWDPPKEDYDAVGDTLWPDPIPNDMEGKPAWIRRRAAQQTGGMTQADLQQVKRCYAGSVRVIDRWIGKLLDWLETSGHKMIRSSSSAPTTASCWATTACWKRAACTKAACASPCWFTCRV